MTHRSRPTWLEIDTEAIRGNVRWLHGQLSPRTKLMAVVKADGYGHGAIAVAHAALEAGASALAVAIPEEGAQLREAGIDAPVLVLGAVGEEGAALSVAYGLAQTVFDTQTVVWLSGAARRLEKPLFVHIKVDSGMGRIGVRDEDSLMALAGAVSAAPGLRLGGIYTHFASADEADLAYTSVQHERFLQMTAAVRRAWPEAMVHAANSAALLRCPQMHHDMVRAGIAMYLPPRLPGAGADKGLRQAMRWITHAVHVKEIAAGETVSYGRVFTAMRPTRVMTLPVGYADGYHRAIGGRGAALVRGRRVPVIGRVCMDQAMLDVTDVPGAETGDEVVLLGAQEKEFISAAEMGAWCGMIDYEAVLAPTARVPRVYT